MAKKKHRDYQNNYPSVTTIIGQLQSYGLMNWFKVTPLDEINRASKRGREIGTQMHEVLQEFAETGKAKIDTEFPEEITTALKSFMLFKKENSEFELQKSEIQMTSEKYKVNGTTDIVLKKGNVLFIGDYKSGNVKEGKDKPSIFQESKIQISAYINIYNDVMNANIENGIIISLAKNKIAYDCYEISKEESDGEFNEVFLPLLKIWRYNNDKR